MVNIRFELSKQIFADCLALAERKDLIRNDKRVKGASSDKCSMTVFYVGRGEQKQKCI